MYRFFTEEEFNERAIKFYYDFMIQSGKKGSNLRITHEPNSCTTLIYNSKNGKTGLSKLHRNDVFDIKIGIGVAWQRYCKDYIEPIYIKPINYENFTEGDIFICKCSLTKDKQRQVYKIVKVEDVKSTITDEYIRCFRCKCLETEETHWIHCYEQFYTANNEDVMTIYRCYFDSQEDERDNR